MSAKKITTNELVHKLCHELDHDEGAAPCLKKLVKEHWIESFDDLRKVPRSRMERWGLPLKLVDEIADLSVNADADAQIHGMQAFVNYNVRPKIQQFTGSTSGFIALREDAERRRTPKQWAAKKIQRNFRRRRNKRLMEEAERFEEAISRSIGAKEVSVMSDAKAQEVRQKRAEEKIRRAIRRWQERKKRSNTTRASLTSIPVGELNHYYDMCPTGPGSLVVGVCARQSKGTLKDCEVTNLIRRFAKQMQKPFDELLPYAHRMITFNWIENLVDLDILEEHHWDEWGFPERLVVLIKEECEANGRPGLKNALCSCCTGTASCCIGDGIGACCDYLASWWHFSDEQDRQKARERERKKFEEQEEDAERAAAEQKKPAKMKALAGFKKRD